jgi:hypothetical protein
MQFSLRTAWPSCDRRRASVARDNARYKPPPSPRCVRQHSRGQGGRHCQRTFNNVLVGPEVLLPTPESACHMPSFNDVLTLVLVAPLGEELVFRAGLQEQLHRWGAAALPANLGATAAFALAHALARSGVLAVAVCVPSLCLGALYAARRRVAPCVAVHAAFNAAWLFALAPALATMTAASLHGSAA